MTLSVAILAGGLATRLRPITEKIPKSLVQIAGRPFICWQLEFLKSQGIERVILCVGHLGEMIESIIGDGREFGLKIYYSYDGKSSLGTGGAINKALPMLGETFFVLYGDSFLPLKFAQVEVAYKQKKKAALMTVYKNQNKWDASNVLFTDGELHRYDKANPTEDMKYIDYGLSILSSTVFSKYKSGAIFDLADLYYDLAEDSQLSGYEVRQRFYEIGSHKGLKETEDFFNRERIFL